jgi:hypothetical protein
MTAAASERTAGGRARPGRASLFWLNVLGGIAVLGSYAYGVRDPAVAGALWGGVPASLRPLYTANMFLAAGGYFAFSYFVFFRLDPARTRVGGLGYGVFHLLYALILLPSALWLPLTAAMIAAPGAALWAAIRFDLALVGLGSLGLLAALLAAGPSEAFRARRAAVVGALFFCLQTAVLDALVWPAYYPF